MINFLYQQWEQFRSPRVTSFRARQKRFGNDGRTLHNLKIVPESVKRYFIKVMNRGGRLSVSEGKGTEKLNCLYARIEAGLCLHSGTHKGPNTTEVSSEAIKVKSECHPWKN